MAKHQALHSNASDRIMYKPEEVQLALFSDTESYNLMFETSSVVELDF